jgi:hypothetical protein
MRIQTILFVSCLVASTSAAVEGGKSLRGNEDAILKAKYLQLAAEVRERRRDGSHLVMSSHEKGSLSILNRLALLFISFHSFRCWIDSNSLPDCHSSCSLRKPPWVKTSSVAWKKSLLPMKVMIENCKSLRLCPCKLQMPSLEDV